MERETLLAILRRVEGVQRDGDRFLVSDHHELTLYLGEAGRALAIDHVLSVVVTDTHLEIEARERGVFYVGYDAVHALLDARRKARRGAAGVGF